MGSLSSEKLRVIPLGGLGEIGKNMMVYEYGNEIIVVDAGLSFAGDLPPGSNYSIPSVDYLVKKRGMIRGIFITHGHEDHIGAIRHVANRLNAQIYATGITAAMISDRLSRSGITSQPNPIRIEPGSTTSFANFSITPFRVNHSIPDAVGFIINTPVGKIVHTGDFKIDMTPVDGQIIDLEELERVGKDGVLALFSDSTNAERSGSTESESAVRSGIETAMRNAKGRVIVASFSSNIHRIQQIIDIAATIGRKVSIVGKSMENLVGIASSLKYLIDEHRVLVPLDEALALNKNQVVIITTGSQGETTAALSRMAGSSHKTVTIEPGDTVIISATTIPGNEREIGKTINSLLMLGATVVSPATHKVHVSGHASQDDLRAMIKAVSPKFFVPIHGEYRHLFRHAELAEEMGIPKSNILIGRNGCVFEFTNTTASISDVVGARDVFIDENGSFEISNELANERKTLSSDGVVVVVMMIDKKTRNILAGPDTTTRGFSCSGNLDSVMSAARKNVRKRVETSGSLSKKDIFGIKRTIENSMGTFLYRETRKRPVIIPIVIEL